MRTLLLALLINSLSFAADRKQIFPEGVKPVGPYSPGIQTGDYVYVSGQGARDAAGNLPPTVEGQTRQCLMNIKAVVEAAGLTMDHVIYTHVYMTDLDAYDQMNAAYKSFFHEVLPARSTMGTTRMPLDTPVEISAIAIRDKTKRHAVEQPQAKSPVPLSAGITTPDRYFISGILGRNAVNGRTPHGAAAQMKVALKRLTSALASANLDPKALLYMNVYRTPETSAKKVEKEFRAFAPHTAISVVEVSRLPFGVSIGVTAVAAVNPGDKHEFRGPSNQVTCTSVESTVYCAAQNAQSATAALKAIAPGLESLGATLSSAVANTVYLDDIDHFKTMNTAYAEAFTEPYPTRTTVQPVHNSEHAVTISVVAVRER